MTFSTTSTRRSRRSRRDDDGVTNRRPDARATWRSVRFSVRFDDNDDTP
jgi:hypothetical protein